MAGRLGLGRIGARRLGRSTSASEGAGRRRQLHPRRPSDVADNPGVLASSRMNANAWQMPIASLLLSGLQKAPQRTTTDFSLTPTDFRTGGTNVLQPANYPSWSNLFRTHPLRLLHSWRSGCRRYACASTPVEPGAVHLRSALRLPLHRLETQFRWPQAYIRSR